MASAEKAQEIRDVIEKDLSPTCSKTIERYGKSTNTMEKNCELLTRYQKFLEKKGCTLEDHGKLRAVLECDGPRGGTEYQEQKDVTDATPGADSVTQGRASTIPSASKGPQAAGNVTKASR